jgi:hypothetical protein
MMLSVLGCPVSETLLAQWSSLFLCDAAPFFFTDELTLPHETLVLSRKALSENQFDLSYTDSYAIYAVSPDAKWVAFLTPAEFDALAPATQRSLLAAQHELRRRQVYLWEQVEHFLQPCIEQAESRCVTVSGEKYFVLDTKIWRLLTDELRRRWLIEFITKDNRLDCLASTLSEAEWSQIEYPSIRSLAGTFAFRSGPNCFSTTLAAVTRQQATAETIANFWLHQETFFQGLAQRGYRLSMGESVLNPDLQDVVLVWQDQHGTAQHACYVIGNNLALNKNSQSWFTPRQLLHLDTLLDDWKDEPFEIVVYRRNQEALFHA